MITKAARFAVAPLAIVFSMTITATAAEPDRARPSISVNAFHNVGIIPKRHTCDGENISPEINIGGVPAEARSLVLIVDDPDAPMGVWNHWILYDIPPDTASLPEGYAPSGEVKAGVNDFRKAEYGGPCPPRGSNHRYFFRLYALDRESLGVPSDAGRAQVDEAMKGAVLRGFPVKHMGWYGR